MPTCPHCGACSPDLEGFRWRGVWYCNQACSHAAGDRTACYRGCGCTGYARKRRRLRAHREQMRIMQDVIEAYGLEDEVEDAIFEETGNTGFWLGIDDGPDGMDEGSGGEDPEADALQLVRELRSEAADQQALVSAVAGALECRRPKPNAGALGSRAVEEIQGGAGT